VVLVLVGILMGASLLTPAVAHVGGSLNHLWGAPGHIKAKVKSYGDSRWVQKTSAGAGPVAFAHVNLNGSLDAARSKNVNATFRDDVVTNYYCVDVAVPFKTINVSPAGGSAFIAVPALGDPFTSCDIPGDVTVQIFDSAGAAASTDFYIVFN
jgi:hypothetical protein